LGWSRELSHAKLARRVKTINNMNLITRREFLERTIVGAGSALLAGRTVAAEVDLNNIKPAGPVDPYGTIMLGKTGIKTSRVCLGTGMRGGNRQSNHTRMGKEKFETLVRGAFDRGTTMFDLADLYGTHPFLIPALREIPRDRFAIVSKIWWRPGGIPEKERPDSDVVVQRFLKELKTDYIDLVLLHCVESPRWPQELRKQMDLLAELKSKGTIRAHGVSCHTLGALQACAAEPWVDSVHARINPTGVSMDDVPEKVAPVLKQIHDAGKGVVGMKIVGEGRYRNSDELRNNSLRYVLGLGCVDILNVGCENLGEVDDLAERVRAVSKA
jgi:aryl-alcohol dehydrogenase-like predicted oxidoreductase